ncbi:hypothetical protein [Sporomusa acidovorans]|nr:hypothetical protein [Sporomusa acidovorans]
MKYRLLVVLLMFGMLPIVVMFIAARQTPLGLSREFHSTMAIGVMVTSLAGLISPGLIRQWLFSNRIQKMKEFCQSVKDGSSYLEGNFRPDRDAACCGEAA